MAKRQSRRPVVATYKVAMVTKLTPAEFWEQLQELLDLRGTNAVVLSVEFDEAS